MIEVQKSGFTVSAQGEGIQYARDGEICNALDKGFGPFLERGRVAVSMWTLSVHYYIVWSTLAGLATQH